MFDYVKDHDFGYGSSKERKKLFKLELRNVQDVKTYVQDALENLLNAKIHGNVVKFVSGRKEQFFVERV